jgi:hypothetical protein
VPSIYRKLYEHGEGAKYGIGAQKMCDKRLKHMQLFLRMCFVERNVTA